MPLIVDDDFYDDPDVRGLPDCSRSFLLLAGAWSARKSLSGFVPSQMLASFSDDPGLVTRTLCSAGLAERVKGGIQIVPGRGITVENAADVEEREAAAEAKAEAVRTAEREKKRRQREARKAERIRKLSAANNVPRDKPALSPGTSPGTPQIDRSDLDQSIGGNPVGAHARESPATLAAVADAICAKTGTAPTDGQVLAVCAAVRARARRYGKRIRTPASYIPAAVTSEPDLYAGLLDGDPPPVAEIIAGHPPGEPGGHHEYHPGCCVLPEGNWRHVRTGTG